MYSVVRVCVLTKVCILNHVSLHTSLPCSVSPAVAVCSNHIQVVTALLRAGQWVYFLATQWIAEAVYPSSPLGWLKLVLTFVLGTDLSLSNEYGNTPLHLAQSRLRILQEGSLTGRTPDAVKAEVSEVNSEWEGTFVDHSCDLGLVSWRQHAGCMLAWCLTHFLIIQAKYCDQTGCDMCIWIAFLVNIGLGSTYRYVALCMCSLVTAKALTLVIPGVYFNVSVGIGSTPL